MHSPATLSQTPFPTSTPRAFAVASSESITNVCVTACALAAATSDPPTIAAAVVIAAAMRFHLRVAVLPARAARFADVSRRSMPILRVDVPDTGISLRARHQIPDGRRRMGVVRPRT
ncbi:hypothetical protein [Microbacterium imperiale]|uniref:hypothetical protein n=1 Tax=Microbacterium imperiale TaxID=33884 RepID=UPI0022F264BF|nr:hypothetical protein [Microbacterium imperiale]